MNRKTVFLVLVNALLVFLLVFGDKIGRDTTKQAVSSPKFSDSPVVQASLSEPRNKPAVPDVSIVVTRPAQPSLQAPDTLEDSDESNARRVVAVEGGGQRAPVGVGDKNRQLAPHCFRNRVMWQPSTCSNMFEVLGKFLDRRKELGMPDREFHVTHIGARDGIYKVAEMSETFGNVAHGTYELGQLLYKIRGPKEFCGFCCECVSRDPSEETRGMVAHNITFLRPGEMLDSHVLKQLGPRVHVKPLPANTMTRCPPNLVTAAVEALKGSKGSGGSEILTLDAWTCDAEIVEKAIVQGSFRPVLFQMTLVNSQMDYEVLLDGLLQAGYNCYVHTTKPSRIPRGMRHPVYPMAVLFSGCWRDVYGVFKGDRYHLTCTSNNNTAAASTLTPMTRMVHKGMFTGCMIVGRPQRLAKWRKELPRS